MHSIGYKPIIPTNYQTATDYVADGNGDQIGKYKIKNCQIIIVWIKCNSHFRNCKIMNRYAERDHKHIGDRVLVAACNKHGNRQYDNKNFIGHCFSAPGQPYSNAYHDITQYTQGESLDKTTGILQIPVGFVNVMNFMCRCVEYDLAPVGSKIHVASGKHNQQYNEKSADQIAEIYNHPVFEQLTPGDLFGNLGHDCQGG